LNAKFLRSKFLHKLASLACYPAPVRILALLAVLLVGWLPIAAPIALWLKDPNTVTILTMLLLLIGFLILIQPWGRWLYRDKRILRTYGLVGTRQNGIELLQGLAIGLFTLVALFSLEGWLGWLTWQSPVLPWWRLLIEGLLVGLGTAFAEELVFRGWILNELQRDYRLGAALGIDSLLFAALHFIKPLPEVVRTFPQFPGLILLGLALGWARQSTLIQQRASGVVHYGRLGLPIGLHGGLVWGYYLVNVGQWIDYSDRVPQWITGIDNNPLAGGIGLLFLAILASYMGWRSAYNQFKQPS
jgi:uncharacterized protein